MVSCAASPVEQHLADLPNDRRALVGAVRDVVNAHLPDGYQEAWRATGKKLDMGKSCVRFARLDQVPLEVVGQAIARIPVQDDISRYEASRAR